MKIIMLKGKSHCGKTTTLGMVYKKIIAHGGMSTNKVKLGGDRNDFSDIVIYNNLKIAFYTMGDYSKCIIDAMTRYDKDEVDVFFCACNSRFVRPERKLKQFEHSLINKIIATEKSLQNAYNEKDSDTIYQLSMVGILE
jgi:hypothetical protein